MPLAVGHMLDEDVGEGVAEMASEKRVDGDACLPWSCCESLKSKWRIFLLRTEWPHA